MSRHPALETVARNVIDANMYMVLATANTDGRPWVSPVYFTPDGYTDFYWVSSPEALHSRNIADRPDVSIVVFDSQVAIGDAEAVYLSAAAEQVNEHELDRCVEVFNSRVPEVADIGPEQLRPPGPLRLYRATVTEVSILIRGSDPEHGRGVDSRMPLQLG